MTIEGAIADLQNLIDSEGIPFWAKPSLQKVMETVEEERERYIEERNNKDIVSRSDVISICNILADKMDDDGRVAVEQVRDAVKDMRPYQKTCRDCKVAYDSEGCYECTANVQNTSAPTIIEADREYGVKAINRGNCMACGKELTEGVFFCKECEEKGREKGAEE